MKKILFVIGTRPEMIKTASVIQALRKDKSFKVGVCLSGQHISMVNQMLKDFNIKLDYDLKMMRKNQTLVSIAKNLMPKLEKVYDDFKPDIVFVQGDTTTAFIAAFISFYKKIKVAHIEAGLRTFDRYFPFPEEMNRTLLSRLADRHYAPTKKAKDNLIAEGVPADRITITGNTCIDSLKHMADKKYGFINRRLRSIDDDKKIILLTAHRRENFGKRLVSIFRAVRKVAMNNRGIVVIYPVHPNPNVKATAYKELSGVKDVLLLPNLHYRDIVRLMSMSYFILTDSGGIQEEAPSLGKPVLILRDKTERPEVVEAGSAKVIGTDSKTIAGEMESLLKGGVRYRKMSVKRDVFGDGKASQKIRKDLTKWLEG